MPLPLFPEAEMDRRASDRTDRRPWVLCGVVRSTLVLGAFLSIWLLWPASASASEDPLDTVGETTEATVDEVAQAVDEVDQAVDEVARPAAERAEGSAAPLDDAPSASGAAAAGSATLVRSAAGVASAVEGPGTAGLSSASGGNPRYLDGFVEPAAHALAIVRDAVAPAHLLSLADATLSASLEGLTRSFHLGAPGTAELPTGLEWLRRDGPRHRAPWPADRGPWVDRSGDAPTGHRPSARGPTEAVTAGDARTRSAGVRTPVDDTTVAFFILTTLLLCLARWSRREAEVRITPVFLSLAERPG